MDVRGLVAPIKQPWHHAAMGALLPILTHRSFVFPSGHCPKSVSGFTQDSTTEKPGAAFRLVCDLECVPDERQQISERSNPEAGHGYEWHHFPFRFCII